MAKTRLPEETQKDIANRLHGGEDVGELAERFGVSVYTVREYGRKFPEAKKPRVRRKITAKSMPKENTSVSDKDREIEFWKDAFLVEFQKNRKS